MSHKQATEPYSFIVKLKNGIWSLGILSWLFGITDRNVAVFADGHITTVEFLHLLILSFLFVGWLYLRPEKSLSRSNVDALQNYRADFKKTGKDEGYLCTAQARMLDLQGQHIISQEYILPFSYLCQIYHLLNLKHLESIHNFSLSNLKVLEVSDFQLTATGGMLKFKTILNSSINILRVWRQPLVEVELILHTPYTVELSIPVYNHRKIIVMFNALPLSNTEHKLFIDIYSNLEWPRLFLQILLHVASCLTLFEDLPYLRKLAERNRHYLVNLSRSNQETMWLFKRFVDLYGSEVAPSY
jgi:hypothetical protein